MQRYLKTDSLDWPNSVLISRDDEGQIEEGPGNWCLDYEHESFWDCWTDTTQTVRFVFQDPDVAFEFKMRWG